MRKISILLLLTVFIITGCSQISIEKPYNQDSRKTLIPETCNSFSDGCNKCSKDKDGTTNCTLMYCDTYQEPKCLDNGINKTDINNIIESGDTSSISSTELNNRNQFDYNSWEKIISTDCKSFFDGCNNCMRKGDSVGCTKMFCKEYQEPKCLD